MTELDDHELLAAYARRGSEAAFATLVSRHVNLVHSAAYRFTGDSQHAEEITQAVFFILARKAGRLGRDVVLSGWLYQAARLTAANFVKGEIRRQKREREAGMQSTINEPETNAWEQIAPLLDEAMGRLGETDRNAVVLRYFENKTAAEIGARLKLNEEAAHKRVQRALEKLRKFFTQRGIALSAMAIAGAVSANSVQAAPAGLAHTISTATLAQGTAAGGSTLALAKGALKVMAWTKAKAALITAAVVLVAAGTTTVTVKEVNAHRVYDWQQRWDFSLVDKVPPQVTIRPAPPTRSPSVKGGAMWSGKSMGLNMTVPEMMEMVWFTDAERLNFATSVPPGTYDLISNLPHGAFDALRQKVRENLGLEVRRVLVETNALILTIQSAKAPGMHPATEADQKNGMLWKTQNSFTATNLDGMWILAQYLEDYYGAIVVDRTGDPRNLDVTLKWDGTPEGLKRALRDQLGLRLAPSEEPVPVILQVVDKASASPTLEQKITADIQPDGSVHYQATVENINRSGTPLTEDFIEGIDTLDRITDAAGQPVKFTMRRDGSPFCVVALNQPVPPGGKYSLKVELTLTNACAPTVEPGGFAYQMQDLPGNDGITHSVEVYRLPPRAILVARHPADFKETTADGRVVLSIDRTIAANAIRNTDFRYRLAAN